jgi:hypothetical protein
VTAAGGTLFLNLKRDRWNVVAQRITTSGSRLQLKITYSLSQFCSLAHGRSADAAGMPLTSLAVKNITGIENRIPDLSLDGPGAIGLVFLLGGGQIVREVPVVLVPGEDDPRTFTATFTANGRPFVDGDLCFAFPPGKGMVTIANVQLLRSR